MLAAAEEIFDNQILEEIRFGAWGEEGYGKIVSEI